MPPETTTSKAPAKETKFQRAARNIAQRTHGAVNPEGLLARILELEEKVFGKKHPAVEKAAGELAEIAKAEAARAKQAENTEVE